VRFPRLLEGRLLGREKRFFAHVELADGTVVTSHCPNPGSMRGCARERARVWLSESDAPGRRLRFTWELVEAEKGALVCVNTGRANPVVAEGLAGGAVAELRGWGRTRREVRYGERSRVDFLLRRGSRLCYLEVKSVTLDLGGRVAGFPDSVTERGRRHLEELMAMSAAGHRAVLLFAVSRSGALSVRPADDIDPRYGETLRLAARSGVEVLAYATRLTTRGMTLSRPLPVEL
jgi:sugar fermentation stimulation protein A